MSGPRLAKQLRAAALHGDVDSMKRVMSHVGGGTRVNVDTPGLGGMTPLHNAAFGGHVNAVKLLVANGADVQSRNKEGLTAFDTANRVLDRTEPATQQILKALSPAKGRMADYKAKLDEARRTDWVQKADALHVQCVVSVRCGRRNGHLGNCDACRQLAVTKLERVEAGRPKLLPKVVRTEQSAAGRVRAQRVARQAYKERHGKKCAPTSFVDTTREDRRAARKAARAKAKKMGKLPDIAVLSPDWSATKDQSEADALRARERVRRKADQDNWDEGVAALARLDLHVAQTSIVDHQGVKAANVRYPACVKEMRGAKQFGRYDMKPKGHPRCTFQGGHCTRQVWPGTMFCKAHGAVSDRLGPGIGM
jgi:hypothetical protein